MKSIFAFLFLVVLMSCGNNKTIADTEGIETPAADTPDPNDGNTAIYDVDDDDPYLISNGYFLGLTPGGSLAEFVDGLRSGVLQTGDGDFDVHYIDSAEGDELGYVMADPRDGGTIGNIYITSPKVVTEEGIRVGISYSELVEKLGALEVHGSEIEGQTYAISDGISYRLDAGNWSYEIDPSTIEPDTKIIEIVVER
ncbi:hypothetical protein [Neolewinella persica]|uniref:hypothetical protein n=1 Tax=Neolewinella persica TaxID=70998 RepID=UPI00036C3430|nr:hypothetical protein [Neolewinella persica]